MVLAGTLVEVRERLEVVVAEIGDGSVVHGSDAEVLLGEVVRIERIAAALRLTLQRRAAEAGSWERSGDPSPQAWLAKVTGESLGQAARSLDASRRLEHAAETRGNLVAGKVSVSQAATIAEAVEADAHAEHRLNLTAQSRSTGELVRQARLTIAAARANQEADRDAIHHSRFLRTWTGSGGAFEGRFRLTPDHGAIVDAAIRDARETLFCQARAVGQREPSERYDADALVDICRSATERAGPLSARPYPAGADSADAEAEPADAEPNPERTGDPRDRPGAGDRAGPEHKHPPAVVHVRVDYETLRRGHTQAGETCEIDGIGPVPVATARRYAEDAILRVLLVDGDTVLDDRPAGRTIPAGLRRRLEARDPTCAVPGCGRRHHLEIHHLAPFAAGGPTTLENLARICAHHHDQITYHGAALTGPAPHWTWHLPGSRPPIPSGCSAGAAPSDAGPDPPGPDPPK